jgi:filamentous hemagglutinin
LTVAQAEQELLTQANLMLQNGSPGTWNERAAAFLREHKGLLPADGDSGTSYMFFATPEQRANPNMYAQYYTNSEQLNQPGSVDIANSIGRQEAYRDLFEKGTWGAAVGAMTVAIAGPVAMIPGAPILSTSGVLGSGALASPVGTGTISATLNAGAQYLQNGHIDPIDVGGAFITGAAGSYGGLLWNVGVNTFGGATTTALNNVLPGRDDSFVFRGVVGGASSSLGYGAGRIAETAASRLIRPTINGSPSWAEVGKWAGPSGLNLFIPNNGP